MSATQKVMGHVYAIFTILVWGSCFVLTKQMLTAYTAIQIIPLRMGLAYITLWALRPKTLKLPWKDELMFILIGVTGGSFYFFLQNTALTYTFAANVSIIIALSPIAIFAIIAWLFSTQGMHTILALLKLVLVMYLGLGVLLVLFAILMLCIGEQPLKTAKAVSEPVILAFATRSSEATLPLHMEKLVEMGVPKAVASVVLPLGYAFNRDGSIMYFALAVGFLADAYNIPLDPSTLLSIIVVTTLASKGSANVPSGGLVAIAMVLTTIGIPVEALAIIAGVDAFLDMGRTAVNVVSNTVAVKLVMRWAGIAYEPVEETAEV